MSTPILATKLFIPKPGAKIVIRPRLLERLNEGLSQNEGFGRKLTLVSAPAGFGKTTLVSEWIAGCERPIAWLSLDEGDNDLIRFLTYLIAALQTLALSEADGTTAKIGTGVMEALQSPQAPATESILTALLNDIATIQDKFVLVLDDYHVIDARPVNAALTFLLDHLPPQMHMVITTREDPQLPLPRLRARGQMTELRAADLRFTPAEAAGFLNQVMGLNLSAEQVNILETRTEGWIAGLQLAALSMRGREDVAGFVRAFAGDNRYIVDYLLEEVLQRQPDRVRNFLLQTSILDRLSGPLCDAVTGQNDGTVMLNALERGNLFVVPLDDQRHWFRYHHLFADVLATHALREQPAQVVLLHQRASMWYADNGLPADAIRHALAAKDFARAAGLIELAWPAMDGSFQAATWLSWAKALPDELVRARPVLSVAYAWAFLNGGDLEAAEAHLRDAEQLIAENATDMIVVDAAQFRTLPASIATARAYYAQARGDIPGSVKYGQQALDFLPQGDHLRRGPAAALLGLAHWANGDLEAAHRAIADAMANFQKAGNLHFAMSGTFGLADIRTTQGRLRDAVKTYAQALRLALAQGEPPLRGTADLYMGLGELYREQNDLDAARKNLLRSEALGEQAALNDWRYRLYRVQARFKETEGDLAGALDLLDEAERIYRRTPLPNVRPLAALRARVWVAQGRLSQALRWVHEQGLAVDDELTYLHEFEHITLARVLIAQHRRDRAKGSIHEAMQLLDRLLQAAEAGGRNGSVIEILVLQALAHEAQADIAAAHVPLERALTLAEPEGYVRIFVDEGSPMAALLQAAAKQGIASKYVSQLRAAFGETERATTIAQPLHAQPASAIQPLSEREIEVLRLLRTEMSGPDIAEELRVSLNTLRTHTKNIFSKFEVNNRRAAVRRAEELGLY